MNEKRKIHKTRKSIIVFRCFLWLLLVSWIILIAEKKIEILRYVVVFSAVIFSFFFCYLLSSRKTSKKSKSNLDRAINNANQAQEILKKNSYLFTKKLFDTRRSSYSVTNTFTHESFPELIQSPIIWAVCLGTGLILLINPVYVELENQADLELLFFSKIVMLSLLEFFLFVLFFSGVLLKIINFLKNVRSKK